MAQQVARANDHSRHAAGFRVLVFARASCECTPRVGCGRGSSLTLGKSMWLLAQEAARELFLLHLGVHAPRAIISWADSAIEREAEPPAALLDLSTTSVDRIDRFIELLSELKSGCDYWSATRDALSEVYGFVTAHPEEAERIAGALWMASSWGGSDLPTDLRFVTRFEDAFYLGREGYYGTEEEVFRDFLSELSRFRKEPNKSPEPTPTAVTPRAMKIKSERKKSIHRRIEARVAPAVVVAHL